MPPLNNNTYVGADGITYTNTQYGVAPVGNSQNNQGGQSQSANIGNILGGVGNIQSPGSQFVPGWLQDISASTDPASYRQNYINMFQDRINALNQIYDQQLAKVRQEGKGRVGQGTAVLARRNLAGSPRGGAIQEEILEQNRGIEAAKQAERNAKIGEIMNNATSLAVAEATEKRRAKESSTQQYLEYLKGEEARKETIAQKIANQFLEKGVDLNELSVDQISNITRETGLTALQLKDAYSSVLEEKKAADFEKEGKLLSRSKTQAEIDKIKSDIAKGDYNTVDVGDRIAVLDKNTGRVVSYLPKGAKPGEGAATVDQQGLADKLTFLKQVAADAKKLASAAGPSLISRTIGDVFVGDTKFRQLQQYADTLRTNVLTLATDPSIRKYFGPQMSNADVQLMLSAGTTLDPQRNRPKQLTDEITRIEQLLNKLSSAGTNSQANVVEYNGVLYTFPTPEAADGFRREVGL